MARLTRLQIGALVGGALLVGVASVVTTLVARPHGHHVAASGSPTTAAVTEPASTAASSSAPPSTAATRSRTSATRVSHPSSPRQVTPASSSAPPHITASRAPEPSTTAPPTPQTPSPGPHLIRGYLVTGWSGCRQQSNGDQVNYMAVFGRVRTDSASPVADERVLRGRQPRVRRPELIPRDHRRHGIQREHLGPIERSAVVVSHFLHSLPDDFHCPPAHRQDPLRHRPSRATAGRLSTAGSPATRSLTIKMSVGGSVDDRQIPTQHRAPARKCRALLAGPARHQ